MYTSSDKSNDDSSKDCHFTVTLSQNYAKTIKYNITGYDELGEYSNERSYEEFVHLHEILRINWPGCYIPTIPGKKKFNYKKDEFVNERCQLLNIFYSDCGKLDYIA